MEPSQRTRRWHPGEWAGLTSLTRYYTIVTQKADFDVQLYHVLISLCLSCRPEDFQMSQNTAYDQCGDGVKMKDDKKGEGEGGREGFHSSEPTA